MASPTGTCQVDWDAYRRSHSDSESELQVAGAAYRQGFRILTRSNALVAGGTA